MLRIRLIDTVIYLTMFLCLAAAYPPRRNKGLCFLGILLFTAASIGMTVLKELLPAGNMLVYLALFVLMGSLFGALFLCGRFIEWLILLLMFTCTFEFFNGITLYLDLRLFGSSTYYWRLFDIPFMMLGGYAAYRFALHPRRGLPWFCWLPIHYGSAQHGAASSAPSLQGDSAVRRMAELPRPVLAFASAYSVSFLLHLQPDDQVL